MVKLEVTKSQYNTIMSVLTKKAKEIFTWKAATGSHVRDDEYKSVTEALNALKVREESE